MAISTKEDLNRPVRLTATRRNVLIGGGTFVAAHAVARAQGVRSEHYQLRFVDNSRRDTVELVEISPHVPAPKDESGKPAPKETKQTPNPVRLRWSRRDFGPLASFRIEHVHVEHMRSETADKPGAQASERLPLKWTLTIDRASFPGKENRPFRIVVTFERSGVTTPWGVSMSIDAWWSDAARMVSDTVALNDFIIGVEDGAGGRALLVPVPRPQTAGLLRSLFGLRVEAVTTINLSIDRNFDWTILSAYKPQSAEDIARKLYILDIPLEFGALKLRRLRADQTQGTEALAAASGGAGATTPDESDGKKAARSAPPLLMFDDEISTSPVRAGNKIDGLHGEVRQIVGFTGDDMAGKRMLLSAFDLAARAGNGWSLAAALALDASAKASRPQLMAALQHQGDPSRTIAGCVMSAPQSSGIGQLSLRDDVAKRREGPFEVSRLRFTRQARDGRRVQSRFNLDPATKEHAFQSRLGSLVVSALPGIARRPGQAMRQSGIEIEAWDEGEGRRRVLSDFSARLALHSAAIDLPERLEAADDIEAAATATSPEPRLTAIPGSHVSRLEFDEAELLMLVPALSDKLPNFAALGAADVVVPLGPAPLPPVAARPRDVSAGVSAAEFHLDRARLTLLRPSDLLSLKFRFADLVLTVPWPPQKDRAAFLGPAGERRACRAPSAKNASAAVPARDGRPLLVVEFPPQHLAERAYFRQLALPPDLPELVFDPGTESAVKEALLVLRRPKRWRQRDGSGAVARRLLGLLAPPPTAPGTPTSADDRLKARLVLRKAASGWPDASLATRPAALPSDNKLVRFDKRFVEAAATARLPKEQRIYVGAEFLDPDARRMAFDIQLGIEAEWAKLDAPKSEAPDVAVHPRTRDAILARQSTKPNPLPAFDADWPKTLEDHDKFGDAIAEIERVKDKQDADYAYFRLKFAATARMHPPGPTQREPGIYRGKLWFGEVKASLNTKLVEFVDGWQKSQDDGEEKFEEVTEARFSGPSRIAFRINCDDFEPERAGGRIPFSLEGLTNWASMDMAVVRRAERLMQAPAWRTDSPSQTGARLPARWQRRASLDDAEILHFQGLSSSDHLTRAVDREQKGWIKDRSREAPRLSRISAAQRLAEVHASANRAPDPFETALELPFRLFLSPAQDATWKTPSAGVWRQLPRPAGAGRSQPAAEFASELWTARLLGDGEAAGVRAIWSPDFRPEALLSTDDPGAPARGPFAPWTLPRSTGIRSGPDDLLTLPRFRTGLDAYDRHELVTLSSVHGLPVLGRRQESGAIDTQGSQIDPPPGFWLSDIAPEMIGDKTVDLSAIYRPKPLTVSELSLSALGGNLDIDTAFVPPASARRKRGKTSENLFDALSIERWRQRTVLGRDVVVEVVYKGFLFPIGHRASLVKLTERRFEAVTPDGPPVAVLTQRMFLRIGEPEKSFPAYGQPNRARRFPSDKVTILTRRTPDLVDPTDVRASRDLKDPRAGVEPNGRIWLSNLPQPDSGPVRNGTGLCFWPRTAKHQGAEVWFEMRMGAESVSVKLPLIFVDNTAANDPATMAGLTAYYNGLVSNADGVSPTRRLARLGQPVVMAPERKPGDTSYETDWWIIKAEGREQTSMAVADDGNRKLDNTLFQRDSFMEGLDQPPFYPFVERALCRLTQVERLTGQGKPLWSEVVFDGDFVEHGFDDEPDLIGQPTPSPLNGQAKPSPKKNPSGIYLGVHSGSQSLAFNDKGDQAGAMARPEMNVFGISGTLGPLSTRTKQAAEAPLPAKAAVPDGSDAELPLPAPEPVPAKKPSGSPAEYFPASAKLLGIVELQSVVKVAAEVAAQFGDYPRLKEAVDYGSATLKEAGGEVRTVLVDTIIVPAKAAVGRMETSWDEIAQRELTLGGETFSLGKAYPQLGVDLTGLNGALAAATDPFQSDVDFFASLSLIHEAGRRLVRTVERIGRDPLAALAGAQLEALRDLRRQIETIRDALKTIGDLKNLPTRVIGIVRMRVGAILKAKLEAVIVGLIPASASTGAKTDIENIVRVAVAGIVDAALSDSANARDGLTKLPAEIAKRLHAEAMKLVEAERTRILTDIAVFIDQLFREIAPIAAEAEVFVLKLLLSDEVTEVLLAFADAKKAVQALDPLPKDPATLFSVVTKATAPVISLISRLGLAQSLEMAIRPLCGNLGTMITRLRDLLLPLQADTRKALSDIETGRDACAKELLENKIPPETSIAFLQALDAAVLASRRLDEAVTKLTALPSETGPACTMPSERLVLLLRSANERHRTALASFARVGTEARILAKALLVEWSNQAKREAAAAVLTVAADMVGRLVPLTVLRLISTELEATKTLCKEVAQDLTTLSTAIKAKLPQSKIAISLDILAAQIANLPDTLASKPAEVTTAARKLRDLATTLPSGASADTEAIIDSALAEATKFIETIKSTVTEEIEARLGEVVAELTEFARDRLGAVLDEILNFGALPGGALATPLQALLKIYENLIKIRGDLNKKIDDAAKNNPVVRRLFAVMRTQLGMRTDTGFFDVRVNAGAELLQQESDLIATAVEHLSKSLWLPAVATLETLAKIWSDKPALVRLFERFAAIDATFLKVVVVEALDLRGFRREIETLIRELVPSKQTLSYDLSTEMTPIGGIFLPEDGTRLEIATRTVVDLLRPLRTPELNVAAHMGPFGIQLFGSFHVVTINFSGLDFTSGTGHATKFDVKFTNVEIGPQAEYLKQLQAFLSPSGDGPYVKILSDKPGLEAGYGLNLGCFGVGTLSFSNVTLNAAARLPFNDGEAQFVVSIGRSDAPFLISSTIFGGGGYLALVANAKGFIGLECSFDYGGVATLGFGPLTGTLQITFGVYFRAQRGGQPEIGVNFMARGAVHIACFGFSTSLMVRLTYRDGQMQGLATYSFSFSLGIDDIEFRVEVYCNQGARMGTRDAGGQQQQVAHPQPQPRVAPPGPAPVRNGSLPDRGATRFAGSPPFAEYAALTAAGTPSPSLCLCREGGPAICVEGPAQSTDWLGYRSYFEPTLKNETFC